ncbi:MAG: CpsB/CapC family capsule biosynthesis tyrosine phosphatase [Phycisphaerales bacterium JB038]
MAPHRDESTIELPGRGLIDLHNHLLPGIDDGCSDVDESLACVRQMIQAGYVGAVCTPHGGPRLAPGNTPQRLAELCEVLHSALEREGLRFPILPGCELSLTADLLPWIEKHGVQALGVAGDARARRGGAVLFDYWGSDWTPACDEFLDYLLDLELTPVLAHPERMNIHDGWLALLERLSERGVLLQGNLRPLVGRDGLLAQYRAEQLLDLNRYEVMALDAHRQACLPPRLEGARRLRAGWGRKRSKQLLETGPRRLVGLGRSLAPIEGAKNSS